MRLTALFLGLTTCLPLIAGGAAPAVGKGPLTSAEIDRVVQRTMREFSVPGVAVGIVKNGRLIFSKGYGTRELGKQEPVDADTVFAIGSISKSFTTAALAMLVDEGRVHWDDRVIDSLPEFRMYDPYVTREFTIRDLLTHRSGLGTGAGDLLFVTPTDFTREDVLHTLRYLKPVSSFRSQFAYDNLLYVVAGELVRAASGQSWEDFVATRIMAPLAMNGCAPASDRLARRDNLAAPHVLVEGVLKQIPPLEIPVVGPAGGIQCNVNGMARWVQAQLAAGAVPGSERRLFSAEQGAEMWSAQISLPAGGRLSALTHSHFSAYGLGWGLEDFNGFKRVSHNGGLPGMVTHVSLIPELDLGVIVLTNQQDGYALAAVTLPILDGYMGVARRDWATLLKQAQDKRLAMIRAADAAQAPAPAAVTAVASLDSYTGAYRDAWRGPATITLQGSAQAPALQLEFSHTKSLTGPLEPRGPDLFIARWSDRSLDADAYVKFSRDFDGKVKGFTMRAVSERTDFSFDFQDLDFNRVTEPAAATAH